MKSVIEGAHWKLSNLILLVSSQYRFIINHNLRGEQVVPHHFSQKNLLSTATPRFTQRLRPGGFSWSRNWVYVWSTIYVYTRKSSWNPNSSTLEPDRPQYDHPDAGVIAQQYSSATFVSVCFHSRIERFTALFKAIVFNFLKIFLISRKSEVVWLNIALSRGVSGCLCVFCETLND